MNGYPPGVTGNEPFLTGIYPCIACGGEGAERNEDGGYDACDHCGGSGTEPEEFNVEYVEHLADSIDIESVKAVLETVRCCVFDREKEDDRRYLRAASALRRRLREIS